MLNINILYDSLVRIDSDPSLSMDLDENHLNNSKSLAEQILFIKQKHNFDLSNKYIPNYKKKYETSKVIHEIIDFIK